MVIDEDYRDYVTTLCCLMVLSFLSILLGFTLMGSKIDYLNGTGPEIFSYILILMLVPTFLLLRGDNTVEGFTIFFVSLVLFSIYSMSSIMSYMSQGFGALAFTFIIFLVVMAIFSFIMDYIDFTIVNGFFALIALVAFCFTPSENTIFITGMLTLWAGIFLLVMVISHYMGLDLFEKIGCCRSDNRCCEDANCCSGEQEVVEENIEEESSE